MTTHASRRLSRYAGYVLAWTATGLFLFSRDVAIRLMRQEPIPWGELLASWLVGMYVWAALTPVVLSLGERWPIERGTWKRRVALHFAFSVVIAVVQLTIETFISVQLGLISTPVGQSFPRLFRVLAAFGFHGNMLAYWAILGIQAGWHYYVQYQERAQAALRLEVAAADLKTELVRAQLGALKAQIQPHFLFNTLNAVVALVREQKGRQAEDTLARLSDLLRWVLADVETQEVSLRRELEHVQIYLAIEQVRFPDRLRAEFAVDPATLDAAVPHIGLQPIVENAIRHGVERSASAGRLRIAAVALNGALEITVTDDGPGFSSDPAVETRGIGLTNTRERLRQLYGDRASLTTANLPDGGAIVTMRLPFRPLDAEPFSGMGEEKDERACV
jgi:two-component system, LytTR family, sensor kinase